MSTRQTHGFHQWRYIFLSAYQIILINFLFRQKPSPYGTTVGRVAGQRTRPSPQAQSYLLGSCPARDINPVKTDDSFHSFFIYVMIMQELSDDVLLSSVTAQLCGCCAHGALSRLSSVRVEIRMK